MDRRKSIKYLLVGSAATGVIFTACKDDRKPGQQVSGVPYKYDNPFSYGRTAEEVVRDLALKEARFFTADENALIAVLADIIIPADDRFGSANDTNVGEFIDFMANDRPDEFQVPMRSGLQWMNNESQRRFKQNFVELASDQQIEIVEDIAYPYDVKPEYKEGAEFFSIIRNLVATGYFTSKEGIKCIGYVGNSPNVWDGVPEEVLKKHGMAYDQRTLEIAMNPDTRDEVMDWSNYVL